MPKNDSIFIGTSFGIHIPHKNITIAFYFMSTFGSLGFILNIISLFVFRRKVFEKKAIGTYNKAIAIVNNLILSITTVNYVPLYFDVNPLLWSLTSCILIHYIQHTLTVLSSLLDMLITVDRMIRITYPNKFDFVKKVKNINLICFGACLFSMAIHTVFFEYKYVEKPISDLNLDTNETTMDGNVIALACIPSDDILLTANIITILFRIFIPFTAMLVSDIILIYNLKLKKGERYSKREKSFSHSVVALSTFFFVTHLPFGILLIYQTVIMYKNYQSSTLFILFYEIALALTSYNYILPTIVNLIFNKVFRDEFFFLFRLKRTLSEASSTTPRRTT